MDYLCCAFNKTWMKVYTTTDDNAQMGNNINDNLKAYNIEK